MPPLPNSIEGEPVWATYTREYVLPGLLFCAMLYYLIRHVFMPAKDLRALQATLNAAGQEEGKDTLTEKTDEAEKNTMKKQH